MDWSLFTRFILPYTTWENKNYTKNKEQKQPMI